MELLDHMVILFSVSRETIILLLTAAGLFYILRVHKGSNFSTSLPTLVIFWGFAGSHLNGAEMVPLCSWNCISLMISSDVEHRFMCLLATGLSSSEKCLFKTFDHF